MKKIWVIWAGDVRKRQGWGPGDEGWGPGMRESNSVQAPKKVKRSGIRGREKVRPFAKQWNFVRARFDKFYKGNSSVRWNVIRDCLA